MIPRLIADAAALFPVAAAPAIYAWSALLLASASCSLFAADAFRHLIRTDGMRYACCLIFAAVPYATEEVDSVANLQWYLAIAALLLLLPTRRTLNALAPLALIALAGVEFAIGLTTPLTFVYVPIALRRVVAGSWRARIVPLALLAACVLQFVQLLLIVRALPPLPAPPGTRSVIVASLDTFAYRVELALTLGWQLTQTISRHTELLVAAVLTLLSALALWTLARRSRKSRVRWIAGYGAFLTAASIVLAIRERDLVTFFMPGQPGMYFWYVERYFMLASAIFIFLVAFAIDEMFRRRTQGTVRVLALCAVFGLGALGNFRLPDRPDLGWQREAVLVSDWQRAKAEGRPAPAVDVPINPPSWAILLPSEPGVSR